MTPRPVNRVKNTTTMTMALPLVFWIMAWMPAEKAPVMLMIWMQPLMSSTQPMTLELSTKPWCREVKNPRNDTGVCST